MSTLSLSGHEYYVTFIDDYSRKTWIYFLKTKDEVFARFKEFKALGRTKLERRSTRKVPRRGTRRRRVESNNSMT